MKRLTRDQLVPGMQRYQVFDPVIEIDSGETLLVETTNHMAPVVNSEADLHAHDTPEYQEREETGPIFVRGAKPGDMISVKIHDIQPTGYPHAHGCGPCADEFPQEPQLFPVKEGRVHFRGGLSAPYAPMIGDIYTTPKDPKPALTSYFDHGGNMDFAEIKPGNTLYLPVFHEGGLLVMGDCHAAQGFGEVYGEGAEMAAECTVTIGVDRKFKYPRPLVETDDAIIGLACHGPFYDSVRLALRDMTSLFARLYDVSEEDAYTFCALNGSVYTAGCLAHRAYVEKVALVGYSVPKDIKL